MSLLVVKVTSRAVKLLLFKLAPGYMCYTVTLNETADERNVTTDERN